MDDRTIILIGGAGVPNIVELCKNLRHHCEDRSPDPVDDGCSWWYEENRVPTCKHDTVKDRPGKVKDMPFFLRGRKGQVRSY